MQTLENFLKKKRAKDIERKLNSINKILKVTIKRASEKQQVDNDEKILPQLQKVLKIQKNLAMKSGCLCVICQRLEKIEKQDLEDPVLDSSDSYLNLFRLLQHLTMIQPEYLQNVLGELRIPMLFFRRQRKHKINKISRNTSFKSISNKLPQIQADSSFSFIMFKCDQNKGHLIYPETSQTYKKVLNKIKRNEQIIKKIEKEKFQDQIAKEESSRYSIENFIHQKYFEQAVPSLILDSIKTKMLRQNRGRAANYILHNNNQYLRQQLQNHKIHDLQPFCILRYQEQKKQLERGGKFQIFSIKYFQSFIQKRQQLGSIRNDKNTLDLLYIESFTKIKQSAQPDKIAPIDNDNDHKHTHHVYYSEYSESASHTKDCEFYQLSKLQIQLKMNQISKLDSRYLDRYDLEALIQHSLNAIDQQSKYQKIATYKTCKIINFLQIVLGIKVQFIQLKWLLNQYDQLILTQCTQYKIDEMKTLFGQFKTLKEQIIVNGLSLLFQYQNDKNSEKLFNYLHHGQKRVKIEEFMKIRLKRIEETKKVPEQKEMPKLQTKKKRLKQISKSLEVSKNKVQKFKLEQKLTSGCKLKVFSQISIHQKRSIHSYSTNIGDSRKLSDQISKLNHNRILQANKRYKKFKLKPFKTEASINCYEQSQDLLNKSELYPMFK